MKKQDLKHAARGGESLSPDPVLNIVTKIFFKDVAHRSKTEFFLGPGSGINVSFRHWVDRKFAIHEHLYIFRMLSFQIIQVRVLIYTH